ncbi:MAG TPA: cell division protein ZipA C-terminal FtsZ-binding domain-containing protein [Noviherbaspirillum sp.]|nr:cell division protein ZipA C-terminal FtsZ-binding domain-containing protein [Noviherbaspirillum sp.]
MTDLQASLLIIGGTIVVGVISYNKWQEYKARKSVQKAFSSDHDDVLMESDIAGAEAETRREPSLDIPAAHAGPEPIAEETNEAAASAKPAIQKELPIDELIDGAVELILEAPVRGEKLLPKLQTLRHVGSKPVHFVGQREDGVWEEIAVGGIYYGLYAGIQLAGRNGPLNELEFSELITRLRQISDEIDAEPDVPDMSDVMARARALHQFVSEYDAQLSISVRSKGAPWAINTLLAALERQGFDLRPDGRLVMPDGDGGVLFTLSTNVTLADETTPRLTLLLDVPRVAPLRDGFGAMVACARMLATRLDGVVVDDSDQPLLEPALAEISEQVTAFYTNMESAGVPAGSTRALRLFA